MTIEYAFLNDEIYCSETFPQWQMVTLFPVFYNCKLCCGTFLLIFPVTSSDKLLEAFTEDRLLQIDQKIGTFERFQKHIAKLFSRKITSFYILIQYNSFSSPHPHQHQVLQFSLILAGQPFKLCSIPKTQKQIPACRWLTCGLFVIYLAFFPLPSIFPDCLPCCPLSIALRKVKILQK